jgi:hypothetical protein
MAGKWGMDILGNVYTTCPNCGARLPMSLSDEHNSQGQDVIKLQLPRSGKTVNVSHVP